MCCYICGLIRFSGCLLCKVVLKFCSVCLVMVWWVLWVVELMCGRVIMLFRVNSGDLVSGFFL